jgi:two-component system nitrate/nitrite sensor histidine kinase NarX
MTHSENPQAAASGNSPGTQAMVQAGLPQAEPGTNMEWIHNREQPETALTEMIILSTFAEALSHLIDPDEILQLALETTLDVAGMDQGGALLLEPSTDKLLLRAHIGGSLDLVYASRAVQIDEGIVPEMLAFVTAIGDLSTTTEKRRRAMEQEGLQSLLSIPLVSGGRPLGLMVLASHQQRRFTPDKLELLSIVGRHVGSAIHRADLQAQELRTAILEERHAMARQMHDDIAQTLGYLGLQVDNVMDHPSLTQNVQVQAQLEQVRTAIEKAYRRVRMSIVRLGRDIPERFDLCVTLQEIVDEFQSATECRVRSEINIDWLAPLSPLVAIQASHIIHEALSNTRQHASASVVYLTLQKLEHNRIEIIVEDDGQGFDTDSVLSHNEGGCGLRFMAERAERVGGTLEIESRPGQGTRIIVHLPTGRGERT